MSTMTSTGVSNFSTVASTNNTFIYNGVKPLPFSITFAWDGNDVSISLKNGDDIFKLARILTEILEANNIEYNIKTNKKRK